MRPDDGRAIPTFISQALRNEDVTVHGDGSQTRSICYVADEVDGIFRLLMSDETQPVNVGNPDTEVTMKQLAETVVQLAGSSSRVVFEP
jgi:dTDP-glucose 4,6-dehydratase